MPGEKVSAVMFWKQFLAYAVHIDWCYHSIHKHSRRSQHAPYDDIGDASSSLRGSTSSFCISVIMKWLLNFCRDYEYVLSQGVFVHVYYNFVVCYVKNCTLQRSSPGLLSIGFWHVHIFCSNALILVHFGYDISCFGYSISAQMDIME